MQRNNSATPRKMWIYRTVSELSEGTVLSGHPKHDFFQYRFHQYLSIENGLAISYNIVLSHGVIFLKNIIRVECVQRRLTTG
jgi:hypothetical protein